MNILRTEYIDTAGYNTRIDIYLARTGSGSSNIIKFDFNSIKKLTYNLEFEDVPYGVKTPLLNMELNLSYIAENVIDYLFFPFETASGAYSITGRSVYYNIQRSNIIRIYKDIDADGDFELEWFRGVQTKELSDNYKPEDDTFALDFEDFFKYISNQITTENILVNFYSCIDHIAESCNYVICYGAIMPNHTQNRIFDLIDMNFHVISLTNFNERFKDILRVYTNIMFLMYVEYDVGDLFNFTLNFKQTNDAVSYKGATLNNDNTYLMLGFNPNYQLDLSNKVGFLNIIKNEYQTLYDYISMFYKSRFKQLTADYALNATFNLSSNWIHYNDDYFHEINTDVLIIDSIKLFENVIAKSEVSVLQKNGESIESGFSQIAGNRTDGSVDYTMINNNDYYTSEEDFPADYSSISYYSPFIYKLSANVFRQCHSNRFIDWNFDYDGYYPTNFFTEIDYTDGSEITLLDTDKQYDFAKNYNEQYNQATFEAKLMTYIWNQNKQHSLEITAHYEDLVYNEPLVFDVILDSYSPIKIDLTNKLKHSINFDSNIYAILKIELDILAGQAKLNLISLKTNYED